MTHNTKTSDFQYDGKIYNNVSDIQLSGEYVDDCNKLLGIISRFRQAYLKLTNCDRIDGPDNPGGVICPSDLLKEFDAIAEGQD